MPKHDVGSAKWLGNKMKAAGLMKLRWYCQMCEKQCKDENGFKCHQTSEIHMRNMELFCENPTDFIDKFSDDFEKGFMDLLSTRYCYQMQMCLRLEDSEICHAVFSSSAKSGMQGPASQNLQPLCDACSA